MIRRSRWLTLVLAVLATLTGLAFVTATPAEAGSRHSRSLSYVALGDSDAAGFGAGKYVNDCYQSRRGYPALLDRETRASLRTNATCNGATTDTVLATQLSALTPRTQLVTLTVGGNDLGFAKIATICAPGPSAACEAAINGALALLAPRGTGPSVLATKLAATYGAVATAAPRADILVTGYPRLLGDRPTAQGHRASDVLPLFVDAEDARWLSMQSEALDAALAAGVARARATGVRARFVDVSATFAGHALSDRGAPWVNGVVLASLASLVPDSSSFHLTAEGSAAYADALSAA